MYLRYLLLWLNHSKNSRKLWMFRQKNGTEKLPSHGGNWRLFCGRGKTEILERFSVLWSVYFNMFPSCKSVMSGTLLCHHMTSSGLCRVLSWSQSWPLQISVMASLEISYLSLSLSISLSWHVWISVITYQLKCRYIMKSHDLSNFLFRSLTWHITMSAMTSSDLFHDIPCSHFLTFSDLSWPAFISIVTSTYLGHDMPCSQYVMKCLDISHGLFRSLISVTTSP